METPTLKPKFKVLESHFFETLVTADLENELETGHRSQTNQNQTCQAQINQALIEECIGGILVFTDQPQLIYSSRAAQRVLSQLQTESGAKNFIPNEIWHICRSLIQSRHLFPDQNWLIEFDIFTNATTTLHICARWLNLEAIPYPCLLLTLEDRQQAIVNLVLEEAERYGLTPREKNVWLLQNNNYTYKQIATELGITPNTVKKHMRSIYAKKKIYEAVT